MSTVSHGQQAFSNPLTLQLERSRQDLLDLGLRNTLISYRSLRSRGVEVVNERSEHVYDLMVRQRRQ